MVAVASMLGNTLGGVGAGLAGGFGYGFGLRYAFEVAFEEFKATGNLQAVVKKVVNDFRTLITGGASTGLGMSINNILGQDTPTTPPVNAQVPTSDASIEDLMKNTNNPITMSNIGSPPTKPNPVAPKAPQTIFEKHNLNPSELVHVSYTFDAGGQPTTHNLKVTIKGLFHQTRSLMIKFNLNQRMSPITEKMNLARMAAFQKKIQELTGTFYDLSMYIDNQQVANPN